MNILSGDIGGTKTLLQLSHIGTDGDINVLYRRRYKSVYFDDFNDIITDFIDNYGQTRIRCACFGVAGPVTKNRDVFTSQITNLPWQLHSQQIADKFSIANVVLLNDFESIGFGLEALTDDDFVTLQTGVAPPHSPQLIIGAGTGLGVAYRFSNDNQINVLATEAGHCDFAPSNEEQLYLAQHLMRSFERSSIEFVLSGPGLTNVYTYICIRNQSAYGQSYEKHMHASDPAASIAEAASSGTDKNAVKAMNLFVECYAGQASNLALSGLARGGVYIAGGIAPKIIEWLRTERFLSAFTKKGKMKALLEKMPVKVIINPEVGLLGSQAIAARCV